MAVSDLSGYKSALNNFITLWNGVNSINFISMVFGLFSLLKTPEQLGDKNGIFSYVALGLAIFSSLCEFGLYALALDMYPYMNSIGLGGTAFYNAVS